MIINGNYLFKLYKKKMFKLTNEKIKKTYYYIFPTIKLLFYKLFKLLMK